MKSNIPKQWEFWVNYGENLPKRVNVKRQAALSYYIILDCFTGEMLWISPKAKEILGYDHKHFKIANFIKAIHPEDKGEVIKNEKFAFEFMRKLYYHDHFRYNICYSYRVMTAYGKYIRVKQTYQALEVNEDGHMSQSFIFHEVLEDNYEKDNLDFLVFDKLKFRRVNLDNIFDLTKREKEVLDHILDARTSQQISDLLHLSLHTVSTHRKNILSKTNATNFIDLIQKLNYHNE